MLLPHRITSPPTITDAALTDALNKWLHTYLGIADYIGITSATMISRVAMVKALLRYPTYADILRRS